MRFGVSTHGHGAATQVVVAARHAAQAGFDTVVVAGTSVDVVVAWSAATTARIRVRALLDAPGDAADAHRWASIDALSGGRLEIAAADPRTLARLGRAWADRAAPLLPVQSPHPPLVLIGDPAVAGAHRLALHAVVPDAAPARVDDLVDAYRQAWDAGRPLPGVTPSGEIALELPTDATDATDAVATVAHLATLGVAELTWRVDLDDAPRQVAALAAHLPGWRAEAERRHPSGPAGAAGVPSFPLHDRSLR